MFNWFPLMTVKRHREVVADMADDLASTRLALAIAKNELTTLRAQLPKRGEGSKFVGRAG